ncbi:hypothetical protein LY625_05445 [Lysobacter sp. GX 14042]|uniref:hypothetical protein n=1 Tax=Lysobacter sp. GX 14042 TaxID=2907155 RepID=UPI001F22879A|nr:hypothetical protein [Lysobacter sp. GX 14042]MCE7032065.1 hypothetical protein [Lysobacter sp. GX 14042]
MDREPRLTPRGLVLAGLLVACSSILPACSGTPMNGEQTSSEERHRDAWRAVTAAGDPQEQHAAILAFLALDRPAGARPLQVHVFHRASGDRAAIGQPLWDSPQDYEVELRLDGREYRFVPLSRASLEPLFRE